MGIVVLASPSRMGVSPPLPAACLYMHLTSGIETCGLSIYTKLYAHSSSPCLGSAAAPRPEVSHESQRHAAVSKLGRRLRVLKECDARCTGGQLRSKNMPRERCHVSHHVSRQLRRRHWGHRGNCGWGVCCAGSSGGHTVDHEEAAKIKRKAAASASTEAQ